MKRNHCFYFLLILLLVSCDFSTRPYLKHDLKFKKLQDNCSQGDAGISVDANTIGERFEFKECLESSFNGDYSVERKGDTIDVKIGKPVVAESLYNITLDIDTWPVYHFITINGKTVAVHVERD